MAVSLFIPLSDEKFIALPIMFFKLWQIPFGLPVVPDVLITKKSSSPESFISISKFFLFTFVWTRSEVSVKINGSKFFYGLGNSKKIAEHSAAKKILKDLNIK